MMEFQQIVLCSSPIVIGQVRSMAVNGIPLLVMKELLGNIQCGLRIGAAHERGRANLAGLMLHLFYVRRTSCVNIREWDDAFQRRVRPKQHLDHRGITYESQRCNQHLLRLLACNDWCRGIRISEDPLIEVFDICL